MVVFLDTYLCQANKNGTKTFFFEAFDEPWKAYVFLDGGKRKGCADNNRSFGGVEPFWGLFDKDRKLKNVTIPVCT
jgi:glucan 1,3-beta-glucosidase